MLDIKFVVENVGLVKENLEKRFQKEKIWIVDELLTDFDNVKVLKKKNEDLRHERNTISQEISKRKKVKQDVSKHMKQAIAIPKKLQVLDKELSLLQEEIRKKLLQLPNMLHESVPPGKDESKNVEIRKIGKPKKFTFDIKSHGMLAEELGLADFEAGRTVAGQGFNYITGELAQLDNALQRYGVDFLLTRGFTLVVPPMVLNKKTLAGAVTLSDFEDVIYKVDNEDLYLIGTAEHALVSLFAGKTLKKKELPLKLCAVTPCFRKEIGSRGVDTKGLYRMHQFNKVEQVAITDDTSSYKMLEEMQKITEEFFKSLDVPFRVVEISSGDLGDKFAKQYDIEAWFPRQEGYGEVTSAGNCTDYQSRKLRVRFEDGKEKKFVHMVNNTMVATSRAMVAILENHQQKNGSIKIPKALHKYLPFTEIKAKK